MLTHISLFSGIGGIDLAAEWAGFETIAQVEQDPYCLRVLEKHWPGVPRIGDIKDFYVCVANDNETLICETSNGLNKRKQQDELKKNADTAEKHSQFHQVTQKDAISIVHGNAELSTCGEGTVQMLVAEHGCEDREIQTGRTDVVEKEEIRQKFRDGDEGYSQETTTPAKNADTSRGNTTTSGHTTLNHGQRHRQNGFCCPMELPCVGTATRKCIRINGRIDLISAGVPCQPASAAGKREGKEDDKWLWPQTLEVICQLHPRWCLLENVPGILSLEQGVVFENLLLELESQGYTVWPLLIPASGVGAPHLRYRIFVVANNKLMGWNEGTSKRIQQEKQISKRSEFKYLRQNVPNSNGKNVWIQSIRQSECKDTTVSGDDGEEEFMADTKYLRKLQPQGSKQNERGWISNESWWAVEPDVGRVAHGVPNRVDRLKTLGNAVVPQQVYPILQAIADVENSKI